MLSPDEVQAIAKRLVQARLDPLALFITGFVLGQSVAKESTAPRPEAANGATPPAAKPQRTRQCKPRKRSARRGIRNGESRQRAREALAANPDLTVTELSKACGISWMTAKRAKEAHNGSA